MTKRFWLYGSLSLLYAITTTYLVRASQLRNVETFDLFDISKTIEMNTGFYQQLGLLLILSLVLRRILSSSRRLSILNIFSEKKDIFIASQLVVISLLTSSAFKRLLLGNPFSGQRVIWSTSFDPFMDLLFTGLLVDFYGEFYSYQRICRFNPSYSQS